MTTRNWPYYQMLLLRALGGKKQVLITKSPEDAKRVISQVRKCAETLKLKG